VDNSGNTLKYKEKFLLKLRRQDMGFPNRKRKGNTAAKYSQHSNRDVVWYQQLGYNIKPSKI
jgi:hypothetical protein